MRRFLSILTFALLLASCKKDPAPTPTPPSPTPQTILLYMPGRDLLSFYNNNIEGIKAAVTSKIPGKGRILVCYQPVSSTKAVLQEIKYSASKKAAVVVDIKTYDTFNPGVPAHVTQMLNDVKEKAPALKYGLIVGCHGKAWVPLSEGNLTKSTLKATAGASDNLWNPLPNAAFQTRSFGDTGYGIDIPVFNAVLSAAAFHPDYIIFDACFMASIETLYDLRNATDYIIASPCEIMGEGFPYKRIMPKLLLNNGSGYNLPQVCAEYYDYYQNEASYRVYGLTYHSGCISLTVAGALAELAGVMREINDGHTQSVNPAALQSYEGLTNHLFYDMEQYVNAACTDPSLLERFTGKFDLAFPEASRLHTDWFFSAYNNTFNPVTYYSGMTISEPSGRYTESYEQTAWYQATH